MRNNSEIIDFMDNIRKQKNMSISELARKTNVAKSSVSLYFHKTRKFPLNRINDFASALGTSAEKILDVTPNNVDGIVHVPVIGTIACGTPITAEQNIESYREEASSRLPNSDCFFLQCQGESMEPTIPNKSFVLVNPQTNVEDGEIAAVLVDGDSKATLKRVKHQGDIVLLIPDNNAYDPIVLSKDFPGRIIGKAIRVSIDL